MARRSPATAAAPGRLEREDGVAILVFDLPGKKVNTLSTALVRWFAEQLAGLEEEPPAGLVLTSGKPETFIAGADIEELRALAEPAAVRVLLTDGHALMARFAALPCPTVAAIHGPCLGGGLELALACDYRVATDHPKTRLGLPEVQLGLIPGLGGTQRLPRLIGVPAALDLILTGRQARARSARKTGLVDAVCHPADLRRAALEMLARGKPSRPRSTATGFAGRAGDLLARSPLGGKLVYDRAAAAVQKKTGGHYPAPLRAVEVVEKGVKLPLSEALELEVEAFVDLVVSSTAKNLMGLFFMKNDVDSRAAKLAAGATEPTGVAVLGAGLMGAGIAQVLAHRGVQVVLKDRDHDSVARGLSYCNDRFRELVSRRRYRPVEATTAMARLHPAVTYEAFGRVDFVIEAVFEDLEVKRTVLHEVERAAPEGLIFASNTSTLPIAAIAEASRRPERVVGMHFFSPVHKMPLVEIIRHPGTSAETLATTVEMARHMGKTIIVVDDGPGFFTSRVLGPFLNEAAWCLSEGASIDEVDRALTGWGWPVGALALLDEVGLDIARHAGATMIEHFGERLSPPPVMARMIEDGRLGRKAGKGFYRYGSGRKRVDREVYELLGWQPSPIPAEEIAERCWLQMLNEVALTMDDEVIERPADVDIGVIFGLGFPPFRGGILRYADQVGLPALVDRLARLAERHGDRFAPAPRLLRMAEAGERFHAG